MTVDDLPDLRAVPMPAREIDEFLRRQGFGVLALASDQQAYPVPISFGYDDERAYFVYLETGEESRKTRYSRRTERGALLAYEVESRHDWRSAIAYGDLYRIGDDELEAAVAAIEDNAWYPNVFREATPMQGLQWWALEITETTGRKATEDA